MKKIQNEEKNMKVLDGIVSRQGAKSQSFLATGCPKDMGKQTSGNDAGAFTDFTEKLRYFTAKFTKSHEVFSDADYARLAQISAGFVGGLSSKKFA